MQQSGAEYDLLAVFTDETAANAATAKLHKEGFSDQEVFQLSEGTIGQGQFREHGPSRNRSDIFLQTKRSGPNLPLILLLAIAFGIVFGGVAFGIALILVTAHLLLFSFTEPISIGLAVIGVVIGIIVGLTRQGRMRGAIGQDLSRANTANRKTVQGAHTVVALRFPDPDNISRKSRARAILLNTGGKIDRSVGRTE
jgi:hypothetical protein